VTTKFSVLRSFELRLWVDYTFDYTATENRHGIAVTTYTLWALPVRVLTTFLWSAEAYWQPSRSRRGTV